MSRQWQAEADILRANPTDVERDWWAKALTDANFARDALRPIVDAAFAYADGTSDNSETPEEDALLDAVNDYRRALLGAATTEGAPDGNQ